MYGLIGEKLGHSFSKEIHEKLFDYNYDLMELTHDEVGGFLEKREFRAINVTIPYKQTVIPYLYEIDELAQKVGAVNTIVNRDGKLHGYNTDVFGMSECLRTNGVNLKDKNVLILGSGGTSLTAKAVCEILGAKKYLRTSRQEKEGCVSYEQAKTLMPDAQIIINTTPLGMYPNLNSMAADLNDFLHLEAVMDAVYNPLSPMLVVKAKEKGINAFGGLYMLVAQAVKAGEYFTGKTLDENVTQSVYKEILKKKQNLVLIGMPSCGKSAVGKAIAKDLNRVFIDTDEEIKKREGCEISDIFKSAGESGFRDIESDVIKKLSAVQGAVISTGGGAILREENVRCLKQNGFVVFIDRLLELLTPTSDRPLSSDLKSLKKRYDERLPIYNKVCDKKITNDQSLNDTVSLTRMEFLK